MNFDERILILTSSRKDAESTERLLKAQSDSCFEPFICENFECLLQEITKGAGAILIAKEVLIDTNLDRLSVKLSAQPSWSDLPVVVLVSSGDLVRERAPAMELLKRLRNTTILERPVRVATLVSILVSALADRRRQYEVQSLVDALEKSKAEAERANRAKSDFLANMSHEIRTPLGAVLGFSDLVVDDGISKAERDSYAKAIRRNGDLLLALVNDILDLSKVEAGKIELEKIEISIREIISEVISSLLPVAEAKGIKLNISFAPDTPRMILSDPIRIKQILTNVVGNAVKFTSKGGVWLDVFTQPHVSGEQLFIVEISDSGLGISTSQQSRLFQPFVQADTSTTRAYGGTGLGLVLSRKLAQALGGDLELVRSTLGEGSLFRASFRAPVIQDVQTDSCSQTQTHESNRSQIEDLSAVAGMKVLLVEDSLDNQVLVGRVLQRAGIEIDVANDGLEGIEKAHAGDYDVILMDMQMPRLDGNSATARLRSEGYTGPIIALTAHALKGDRDRAIECGFDDYLTKPLQRPLLITALKKYRPRNLLAQRGAAHSGTSKLH